MNLKKYKVVFKSNSAVEQFVHIDIDVDDKNDLSSFLNICGDIGDNVPMCHADYSKKKIGIPTIAFNLSDVLFITEV